MTNGIKIPISADLSGLNQAVDQFSQKAKQALGAINGSAQIDTASAQKGLAELEKSVKHLQGALSKTAASDVTGKSLDGLAASFDAAVKNAKVLEQAIGGIGSKGASSFRQTVGETRKLITELEKARRLQATLAKHGYQYSLGELQQSMQNPPSPTPGPAPGPQPRRFGQFFGDSMRTAGRSVLGAALPGAGIGGAIAGHAAAEAAASPGGIMSGGGMGRLLAGGAIGALAYGATKAIGSVYGKMRSTEDQNIGYSDLSRQMGDSAASFEELRGAVRDAARNLDMSFGDGSKMAQMYVKTAGIDGLSGDKLRTEMMGAGGFSRSLGLDPQAGGSMFATLRHNGVSSGDADNKRFALMIGEAIARAGVFSKADDVLAAVAGFTQQATRASFTPANVEGYMGGMSNIMSMKMAGLDPNASASLLAKADMSIRGGGSEASRNFALGVLQKQIPGMTAVDAGFVADGGAFGTVASAFGENSPAMMMAKANGDKALIEKYRRFAAQGGNKTTLDRHMDQMSGMNTDDWRQNLMGEMGYSSSEAAAMITAYRRNGSITDAVSNLSKYGIDTKTLNSGSIRNMIDVEYGDGKLGDKAAWLRKQGLSGDEEKSLSTAEANPGVDNSNLKETLIKLLASRGMEMSEGDISRKNMASLENLSGDMATKLIPIMNSVREAVVATARFLTLGTFKDKYVEQEGTKSVVERNKALMGGGASEPGRGGSQHFSPMEIGSGAIAQRFKADTSYDELFKKAGAANGVDWRILKQIGIQESALRPDIRHRNTNGTTDIGIMQLNDRYNQERGVTDPTDPEQNIMAGAGVFARALRDSKGNLREAFRRYNGGKGTSAEGYADRAMVTLQQIAPDLASQGRIGAQPLPAGGQTAQAQTDAQTIKLTGEFHLLDKQTGRKVADPLLVSGVAAPKAAGVRQ